MQPERRVMRRAGAGRFAPRRGPWLVAFALWAAFAFAANLPALTGRIVDQANIVPAATRAALEPKLAALETKSGIQLVVATLSSLDDADIETTANTLFRLWKLGEARNNNGVLLLVAPKERKVRIEVGYGLEGTLTDALSKIVIANAIAPRFKAGDFGGGIERGVDDIVTILTTDASEWQKRPQVRAEDQQSMFDAIAPILIFIIFFVVIVSMMRNARQGGGRAMRRGGGIVFLPTGSGGSGWSGGSSWGGGSSGGGFSGGGGSSGGGGASGDW